MPLKLDANMSAVAHHIVDGPVSFPYAIDAHSAVSRFPLEWSHEPWSHADAAAARQQSGQPDIEVTPEEQAAIDDHAKSVAEANERLAAFRAKKEAERQEAEQIAADEALVKSAPPRPDPNARRPTPAQIRKQASRTDEEIEKEKADADKGLV